MANKLADFVTVREAAGIVGVTESLIRRWVRDQILPAEKIANTYLLPMSKVVAFSRQPRRRGPRIRKR